MENTEASNARIQAGDRVLLVGKDRREFLIRARPGAQFQTHRGIIAHDALIGLHWGETLRTHLGHPYLLLTPSLEKLIRSVQRKTQIVYPKEIGYLLLKLNIVPGARVVEAGTGSGALTLALAQMVLPHGHIYTYEARAEMQEQARENLAAVGLAEGVTFKVRDIAEGFDEHDIDALFLDVREPHDYLQQAHAALKGGGFFGALVPTTNQIVALLYALEENHFGFIEVEELFLRAYKPTPGRLRPADTMVGHTGYLVFARALLPETTPQEPRIPVC